MRGLILLVTLLVVVASRPVKEERNQVRHKLYSTKVGELTLQAFCRYHPTFSGVGGLLGCWRCWS